MPSCHAKPVLAELKMRKYSDLPSAEQIVSFYQKL